MADEDNDKSSGFGEGSENMSCEIVSLKGVCCGIIRDGSPIVAFLNGN